MEIIFSNTLWEWKAQGGWQFVTVPIEHAKPLRSFGKSIKRGFGSVRVVVTIGNTTWKTSVFPDSTTKSYLLPVKKSVRDAEKLKVNDTATVLLKILDA